MNPILQHLADSLDAARCGDALAQPLPGLTLTEAYRVAAHNHQRRLTAGDRPVGRKIGHTNPANWPAQGIDAPSWGWLYAATTWQGRPLPTGKAWREPKVELELVLRLREAPPPSAEAIDLPQWADCIDTVALGLEFVDRPYPAWGGSVADSVAAGGVHAGLWIGEAQAWPADGVEALGRLTAVLKVGDSHSEGGSAWVLGHPLEALARLHQVLALQGAQALQAGEWITTGALAPALPYPAGTTLAARIDGAGISLAL